MPTSLMLCCLRPPLPHFRDAIEMHFEYTRIFKWVGRGQESRINLLGIMPKMIYNPPILVGALFLNNRNQHVSSYKNNDTLYAGLYHGVFFKRNQLDKNLLRSLPSHSFGKCLNNVGGLDMALFLYPKCADNAHEASKWWDHLHYATSHHKFVLAN